MALQAAGEVLVLVHPGSACGSADLSLGRQAAEQARQDLITELDQWSGSIVVIDGFLSDELRGRYADLAAAITRCLSRGTSAGHLATRIYGSDDEAYDQTRAIRAFATKRCAATATFTVSGAWLDLSEATPGGCVGSVHETLASMGRKSQLSTHAVRIDDDVEVPAHRPTR